MKALLILALFVVAANVQVSEAGFGTFLKNTFGKIGDVFKATGHQLLGTLDNIGGTLFDKFKDAGKNLLSQGVQALALNTMNSIKQEKGARDVSSFVNELKDFETKGHHLVDVAVEQLKPLLHSTVESFRTLLDSVKELILSPEEIVATIDKITGLHNQFADSIMKAVVSKITELASSLLNHKRNVMDGLNGIISQLTNSLKPAIEGVKNMVSTTGELLKNAASNLMTNVQQTLGNLLGTLTQHGTQAIDTMKGATAKLAAGAQ
ncbi:hypothetical protein LOTGIDRAFT_230050 [Lottia gigantea]|uniref:Uncharacterized protein n=1 Tax=Lottia gigantea TaxID=225164 RepID=V4ALD8_LOTGI|nr:hypothetical protein LOTGIDRAFT_230050 [Lottia gigantea]ESP05014.1 hypothetical protein LOTGIDRAFT_230050 [Lottia gigantea]